jgi:hypothetical protein
MNSGGLMSILDLSFSKFITVSIIRFVYALLLIAVAIGYVLLVIAGFSQGVLAGVGVMVVGLIGAVIEMIFIRMWLELIVVIFKIGENVSKIAQSGGRV